MIVAPYVQEYRMSEETEVRVNTPEKIEEMKEETKRYLKYVGMYLRNERQRQKLKQDDIANMTGYSRGWVGQVERGENSDHTSAKLIAMVLGVDLAPITALAENQIAVEKRMAKVKSG